MAVGIVGTLKHSGEKSISVAGAELLRVRNVLRQVSQGQIIRSL